MAITEGNPTETQQVTPPPIDYDAMGSAVASALQKTQLANAAQGQPQITSAFQEAIAKIGSNPENDKESLSTLELLFNAHKADLGRESQQQIAGVLVAERVRQARQTLDAEIERVIEADETLAPYRKAVKVLAEKEFDEEKEHEGDRIKLANGELKTAAIRKLVDKHFAELAKPKTKQNGLSGMKTEATSQSAASQASGKPSKLSDLNEDQRELYYSIVAEHERIGLKQLGVTKADMEATALERASTRFKTK